MFNYNFLENEPAKCPEGFQLSTTDNQVCLQGFFKNIEKTDFKSAQDACSALGAYLVRVKSKAKQEELSIITTKNRKSIWLGALRDDESGDFEWEDGEKFDFTSWEPEEPDNLGGVEHCVVLNPDQDLGWHDRGCK